MAEELPSLHIDTDWKKQAQEEKKRLAEEEAKRAASAPPPTPALAPGATPGGPAGPRGRGQRTTPPAGFASLVQSILTQGLFYLGDLAPQGSEPVLNLDMAKYQIDTLTSLEEKTVNNLTPDEQHLLDAALYEARMRFINVASQFL